MIAVKAQLCELYNGLILRALLYLRAHHGYFAAGQVVALIGFLNGFPGIDSCTEIVGPRRRLAGDDPAHIA